jgi:hypothetical protein
LVDEDAIVREARVTHGIVDTVDELQEALAPSGALKQSVLSDGSTAIGYDTRDAQGNLGEVAGNPHLFVGNPYQNDARFSFASNVPDDGPVAVAVIDELSHPEMDAMVFSGNAQDGEGSAGVAGAYVQHRARGPRGGAGRLCSPRTPATMWMVGT